MQNVYDYRTCKFYHVDVFDKGFSQDKGLTARTVIEDCTVDLFWGLVGGNWLWVVARA